MKSRNSKKIFQADYRCSPGTRIETAKGKIFECNGWGAGWVKLIKPYEKENHCVIQEYKEILSFIEVNTDNQPTTFTVAKEDLLKAFKEKKIKYT